MKKRIVFIEDDDDIRFIITVVLEEAGYEVESRPNIHYLNIFDKFPQPDLYLLDRYVHGEDLLNLSRHLKSNPNTNQVPIIIISADPFIKDMYAKGLADDYISKPFDREVLLQKIGEYTK